jgi:hypothetical protein
MKNKKLLRSLIIGCFVAVPLISSIVSTFHLVDLFALGNPMWIAVTLAVAIEIGSVASFLTLSILKKLNRAVVWMIFLVLFFMQIVGNVYFSYDWIGQEMLKNSSWIQSFKDMSEWFLGELEVLDVKMYLSLLIGVPIPLISVFLLKSAVDYIGIEENLPASSSEDAKLPQHSSVDTEFDSANSVAVEIEDKSEPIAEFKAEPSSEVETETKFDERVQHLSGNSRKRLNPARQ